MKKIFICLQALVALICLSPAFGQVLGRRRVVTAETTKPDAPPAKSSMSKNGGVFNSASSMSNFNALTVTSQIKRGNLTYYLVKKTGTESNSYTPKVISSTERADPTDPHRICKTEYRNFKAENMSQDILNPEAISDLRLGAVYDYTDLAKGNFNTGNYTNRNPMYFKITDNATPIKIQQPTSLSLASALDEIKNISFQDAPQGFGQYLETKTVNSIEALNIACGVSYTGFGINVSATVGYNSQVKKNKFLLTYLNPIYTVTALPDETGKLFNNNTDNDNGNYVYIDKITYGVRLLVYFETELSEDDTKLAFSASGYGATGKWASDKKSMVENTTYKLYLFGRNQPLKIGTNLDNVQRDINDLLAKVAVGNEVRPNKIGKPISYSLKFLDGTTAASSCSAINIPSESCGLDFNRPMDLLVSLDEYDHGGYGVDGYLKASLIMDGNEFWSNDLYTVPSQARIGTNYNKSKDPVATLTIPNVSKEVRAGGFLRLSGIWNSDGAYFMSGVNMVARGNNVFYKDIPLKEIIPNIPDPFKIKLLFKENQHQTETSFSPTISASFK